MVNSNLNEYHTRIPINFNPNTGVTVLENNSFKIKDKLYHIHLFLRFDTELNKRSLLGGLGIENRINIAGTSFVASSQSVIEGEVYNITSGFIRFNGEVYCGDYTTKPFRQVFIDTTIYI